jgi:caa(3)-type oxidase subunit IV
MEQAIAPGQVPAEYIEPNYLAIWLYLAVLTALELLVVYARLDKALMIGLLIGLAWAKVAMVAMYFMHLRFERRGMLVVALSPLLLIVVMVTAMVPDVSTRDYARRHSGEVAWMVQAVAHNLQGGNPNSVGLSKPQGNGAGR